MTWVLSQLVYVRIMPKSLSNWRSCYCSINLLLGTKPGIRGESKVAEVIGKKGSC